MLDPGWRASTGANDAETRPRAPVIQQSRVAAAAAGSYDSEAHPWSRDNTIVIRAKVNERRVLGIVDTAGVHVPERSPAEAGTPGTHRRRERYSPGPVRQKVAVCSRNKRRLTTCVSELE